MEPKDLKERIQYRLDQIEMLMYEDYHLKNPDEVYNQTLQVSKFWSILSEEDRDFIQGVQSSIEEGWSWKDDKSN
jgi:uncharacterized protein YydD (DUF2326 family)